MNSLKSACSFATGTPVPLNQFEQHLQPLFRFQIRVELMVGLISLFKATKDLTGSVHA
jgi:hypothetical protein